MKNYFDSTAYDFERFAPERQEAEIITVPENKKAPRHKSNTSPAEKLKHRLSAAVGAVVIMLLVMMQMQCQIQSSEVTEKIYQTKETISTLKSEQTRLNVEIENKVSFYNIEKIASERGMQKANNMQTKYINLCDEDVTEVTENAESIFEKIASWF